MTHEFFQNLIMSDTIKNQILNSGLEFCQIKIDKQPHISKIPYQLEIAIENSTKITRILFLI